MWDLPLVFNPHWFVPHQLTDSFTKCSLRTSSFNLWETQVDCRCLTTVSDCRPAACYCCWCSPAALKWQQIRCGSPLHVICFQSLLTLYPYYFSAPQDPFIVTVSHDLHLFCAFFFNNHEIWDHGSSIQPWSHESDFVQVSCGVLKGHPAQSYLMLHLTHECLHDTLSIYCWTTCTRNKTLKICLCLIIFVNRVTTV